MGRHEKFIERNNLSCIIPNYLKLPFISPNGESMNLSAAPLSRDFRKAPTSWRELSG